jgi:hypothetical protein
LLAIGTSRDCCKANAFLTPAHLPAVLILSACCCEAPQTLSHENNYQKFVGVAAKAIMLDDPWVIVTLVISVFGPDFGPDVVARLYRRHRYKSTPLFNAFSSRSVPPVSIRRR